MWVRVQPPLTPTLKITDFRVKDQTPERDTAGSEPLVASDDLPDDVVPFEELELGDPKVREVLSQAQKIIEKDIPILIHGETGAGKEIMVRSLHFHSSRRRNTLVAVNCASIPTELVESELFGYEKGAFTGANSKGAVGLIRRANGGTLFLDEIGEMPFHVQARLLRVLQERVVVPLGSSEAFPVDIRLVSASNRNLKMEADEGAFRQDLYYRVSGLNIEVPALRHREDKSALIKYVYNRLQENEGRIPMSSAVESLLIRHPWPGNMRQLTNVLKIAHAMADGGTMEPEHLPADFYDDLNKVMEVPPEAVPSAVNLADSIAPRESAETIEHRIQKLYRQVGGNVSQTARLAGVSRNTVYKYVRKSLLEE